MAVGVHFQDPRKWPGITRFAFIKYWDNIVYCKIPLLLVPFLPFLKRGKIFTYPASPKHVCKVLYLTPAAFAVRVLLREGTRGTGRSRSQQKQMVGVKGSKSRGSSETLVMGRPFTMASTSHIRVVRPSSSSTCSFVMALKTLRTVRIHRSHTPPWWEPAGGLNVHLVLRWRR